MRFVITPRGAPWLAITFNFHLEISATVGSKCVSRLQTLLTSLLNCIKASLFTRDVHNLALESKCGYSGCNINVGFYLSTINETKQNFLKFDSPSEVGFFKRYPLTINWWVSSVTYLEEKSDPSINSSSVH